MMYQKLLTIALVSLLLLAGCNDLFEEINTDPNSPTEVDPEQLLPYAIENAVDQYQSPAVGMEFGNLVVQYWARILNTSQDRYIYSNSQFSGFWTSGYVNALADFRKIRQLGKETEQPNYEAIGTIMEAWYYSLLTDSYGDIPYSEALQGIDEGVTQPKFDTQEYIYDSIIQRLDEAQAQIVIDDHPVRGDILFEGDMLKWRKFANSLRFRLLMRISGKKDVSGELQDLSQNKVMFTSNSDNAQLLYLSAPPNRHPFIELPAGRQNEYRMSKTLVDRLKILDDPRLEVFADTTDFSSSSKTQDSLYIGVLNGLPPEDLAEVDISRTSRIGSFFRQAETPGVIMTFAELNFLKAEAAQRKLIAGSARGYYEQGVAASFEQYNVSGLSTYLAQAEVNFDPANALEQIGEQKWIALYGQGLEAWNEWRRTGYPDLEPSIGNDNGDRLPVRMEYPFSVQTTNRENYKEAINRQGGNTINTKVWWDK